MEGYIDVKLATKGYGGRKLREIVRIQTDDPEKPLLQVLISGQVEKFADIQPERVYLSGSHRQPLSVEVIIIPRKEYPFNIKSVKARDGSFIKYELKEQFSDRCVIKVENARSASVRYSDILVIGTDSPVRPEIFIRVDGRIN